MPKGECQSCVLGSSRQDRRRQRLTRLSSEFMAQHAMRCIFRLGPTGLQPKPLELGKIVGGLLGALTLSGYYSCGVHKVISSVFDGTEAALAYAPRRRLQQTPASAPLGTSCQLHAIPHDVTTGSQSYFSAHLGSHLVARHVNLACERSCIPSRAHRCRAPRPLSILHVEAGAVEAARLALHFDNGRHGSGRCAGTGTSVF